MKDATGRRAAPSASAEARIELPITAETADGGADGRLRPRSRRSAARPADVQSIGLPAAAGAAARRHAAADRDAAGDERLRRRDGRPDLRARSGPPASPRWSPAAAAGAVGRRQARAAATPLREGDAVGVALVGGDLELGATGTVTHIDGDRVYAFGHPFYNLGPTEFPMTRAYVHTMLPSLMTSFKISTLGEVIGTMQQDRATAIAGTLGKGRAMIPMTVTLQRDRRRRATKRTFNINVVNDQLFTPLLAYVAMFNTLGAYERAVRRGDASRSRAAPRIKDTASSRSTTCSPATARSLGASTSIAGPLSMLLANDVEPITIDGADITIATTETPRSATIERVWLDDIRPRAGQDGAAQGPDAQLPRRGEDLHGADRHPGQRHRRRCPCW